MKRLPEQQCRRCAHMHEEAHQLVDPEGRWAIATIQCECGHDWTIIYTAPANLSAVRNWIARGCTPEEGPLGVVRGTPWHQYRLEGVSPALISVAS